MSDSKQLVQKLWNYCNILRDDGLSYGDYVEHLTILLFLKMADYSSRVGGVRSYQHIQPAVRSEFDIFRSGTKFYY